MKRTVIDGKVFIIESCKDCPHLAWGEDGYFCNHYNSEYRGGYIILTGGVDSDCPLEDYEGDCKEELEEPRKSELIPCPFCGGDIFTLKSVYAPYIKCEACGTMKTGDTLDECIEKWNRRAIE